MRWHPHLILGIVLTGCPSDGAFGSRSAVLGARIIGPEGVAQVLPGDDVVLELVTSADEPIDVAWVACNGPFGSACTIFGSTARTLPQCPSVVGPCVVGFGQRRTFTIPPLSEAEEFVRGREMFEAWYRTDGGDVGRCVDGRFPSCSVQLLGVDFGPRYSLNALREEAGGVVDPPLESYDEALRDAQPNRHPEILGVVVGDELVESGTTVDWSGPVQLGLMTDTPETFVKPQYNEEGVEGLEQIESYAVTWVVSRSSGKQFVSGPVLDLAAPDDGAPLLIDVLVRDLRSGMASAWLVLD